MTDKILVFGIEVTVEIIPSAFDHGKTAEDILTALGNSIYDETLETYPNKTVVVGFDTNANAIEMIVNVISDVEIVIFHAMDCRKVFRDKILGIGE